MHVPSPNEQDYLVWAAQRTDAGDIDGYDFDEGYFSAGIAPWTLQCLLDGVRRFGEDSPLRFEDIVVQLEVRAGVEARPWELDDTIEHEDGFGEVDVDEEIMWSEYDHERYDGYDRDEAEDEQTLPAQVVLPITESYRPSTEPGGAVLVEGRSYVVWGDWLWEAQPGGTLREIVELTTYSELYCAIDGLLVLTCGSDFVLFDVAAGEFVRRDVDVPVFTEDAREVRTLRSTEWAELPICVDARAVDISPCSGFIRVKDRLGKGGIFEVGTWRRVGDAGGPHRDHRPSHRGPKLGGGTMRAKDWKAVLGRIDRKRSRVGTCSAFCWCNGKARWTDNGLMFYEHGRENGELVLVLDRPVHRASFGEDGREVIASTDDELLRIDLDAKAIVDRWRIPARLRYLRSVLPPYQHDEYTAQIVALWEVLADPNERSQTAPVATSRS